MNLAISNIAWSRLEDELMYEYMCKTGYEYLEIAPTRVFDMEPYSHLKEACDWSRNIYETYGLKVCSLQSIWYGRNEEIFASDVDRNILTEYTKKAVEFANSVGAYNLVFGCPKNRNKKNNDTDSIATEFFGNIADIANKQGCTIALEANPPIYNTNFINETIEAFSLVKKINKQGLRVNLDIGTVIYNEENLQKVKGDLGWINHVHMSEPNLMPIKNRNIHEELIGMLYDVGYDKCISIERKSSEIQDVKENMSYLKLLCKRNLLI